MKKKKGTADPVKDLDEKLEEAGIYFNGPVYFVTGVGAALRMQSGPITRKRGQNGITKDQLNLIVAAVNAREDLK